MTEAGEHSPHLDPSEKRQAAEGAKLGPLVIHELVRAQGEDELARSVSGLAWSGLAAGASIGFSFLMEAVLRGSLPETPWNHLVAGFGYAVGFMIVIFGRQQLFTETTLTALIPALTRRDRGTFAATLRVWGIVLIANLVGTWIFATIVGLAAPFRPETMTAMHALSAESMQAAFWPTMLKAGFAGWLIALMVWLLPGAGGAGLLVIVILTYAVAVTGLNHIVAGSAEAFFGVVTGSSSLHDYLWKFLAPTLLGNTLGGTILVGLLNHAPVAEHLDGKGEARD